MSPASEGLPARPPVFRGGELIKRVPPIVWVAIAFAMYTAVVFRDGVILGQNTFPQGTNALDTYSLWWFQGKFPLGMWLYPFSDWGQPLPVFTGPTLLTPLVVLVPPGTLVRLVEAASWFGSSLSLYVVARGFGARVIPALIGGMYYSSSVEIAQFFEGHIPTMISLAIAPMMYFAIWKLGTSPSLRWALAAAILLYLMASIGDLGILYFTFFFGGLLGLFVIIRRNLEQRYSFTEILTLLASGGVSLILFVSWLFPYLLGARPEYTTGITVRFFPFAATTGQPLLTSFMGVEGETSFVSYLYHTNTYSIASFVSGYSFLLLLLLAIPIVVLCLTILFGSFNRLALYGAALLSMVISTGPLVPGLSLFNRILYTYFPLFDVNPSLLRWLTVTILAYSLLISFVLTDLLTYMYSGRHRLGFIPTRVAKFQRKRCPGVPSNGALLLTRRSHRPTGSSALLAAVCVSFIGLMVLQNTLAFTSPPSNFQFPESYTQGISYIAGQRQTGGTLTIPFSETYEETPWAGVSSPASLMSFTWTQSNTVTFEAGTPYSLSLDQFIGNGLTYNLSNRMYKFLEATNIEYVLATKYNDWSQASSFEYDPYQSYYSFLNQSGIGTPVYRGGLQSVFVLPGTIDNASFEPTYYVYFLSNLGLYEVLNQSWYFGSPQPLVNGNGLGSELSVYVDHSSGIIVPPMPPPGLSGPIQLARSYGVPVLSPDGQVVGGTASTHLPTSPPIYYPDATPQRDPTSIVYREPVSSWGLLVLAQTYSNLWTIQGASGPVFHAAGNIGLNVWLMNATRGYRVVIYYQGNNYLKTSLYLEGFMGAVVLGAGVLWGLLRRRKRWSAESVQQKVKPIAGHADLRMGKS